MDNAQILSVIILSYQSEKNLASITGKVMDKMKEEKIPYEIIIVDDGSKDQSFAIAESLQARHVNIRAFRLSKNYNSPYAMFAGLQLCRGACAVVIPDDLQRPLETVVEQYRKWQQGAKIVIGYRVSRNDGMWSDLLSSAYYFVMNTFTKVNFPPGGADGFLADREVIDILNNRVSQRNTSPIIEVLQLGFDPVFIPFDRPKTNFKSRWTLRKKIALALNTFFATSTFPIKLVTVLGFFMFSFAFLISLFVIYAKIFTDNTLFGFPVPGWATIILVTMFFNGMTMLSLGIIAEYIWRIFEEVKGRPPYVIRDKKEGE